jgi:hypothetical protein
MSFEASMVLYVLCLLSLLMSTIGFVVCICYDYRLLATLAAIKAVLSAFGAYNFGGNLIRHGNLVWEEMQRDVDQDSEHP